MSHGAERALRAMGKDENTLVADFFKTVPTVLGVRFTESAMLLARVLEDEMLCPTLQRLKNPSLVTHCDLMKAAERAGLGMAAKGWVSSIEDWLEYKFPRLQAVPLSAFNAPSIAPTEESDQHSLLIESASTKNRAPTYVIKGHELPKGAPTTMQMVLNELKTLLPGLLRKLKCKVPKLRCVEDKDVTQVCQFVFLYFVCKLCSVYPNALFDECLTHVGSMLSAFMPHLPVRGKKRSLLETTGVKREDLAPSWPEKLQNFFHNYTKSSAKQRVKMLELSRSDCLDVALVEELITLGLPITLTDDAPTFSPPAANDEGEPPAADVERSTSPADRTRNIGLPFIPLAPQARRGQAGLRTSSGVQDTDQGVRESNDVIGAGTDSDGEVDDAAARRTAGKVC